MPNPPFEREHPRDTWDASSIIEGQAVRRSAVTPIAGVDTNGVMRAVTSSGGRLNCDSTETDRYASATETHTAIIITTAGVTFDARKYGQTHVTVNVAAVAGAWTAAMQVSQDGVVWNAGTTADLNLAGIAEYVFAMSDQDRRAPYFRVVPTQGGVGALTCTVKAFSRW